MAVGASPARAQLSPAGVLILDSSRAARKAFSTNERVTFQQKVSNGSASGSRIYFNFIVVDPQLKTVFNHNGNAVPGRVGNAAGQIAGVPISKLYTVPGVYKLTARSTLDAQTIDQEDSFTVSSPNIILIYPPNGAQKVADKPLTFRWSSSGAAKYRVTVGDNPSFFNSVFTDVTAVSGSYSYPENPADARARLASGTLYYWKIEGLDTNGNVVAASAVPFSFSVESVSLTRDIAVTGLEILGQTKEEVAFRVTVENLGGTSESNLQLKFSIGGLPVAGSPVTMPFLTPGLAKTYNFTGKLPADQGKSLAVACVAFFDDNAANNCKTVQLTKAEELEASADIFSRRKLSNEEMWSSIQELLKARGTDLSGYAIVDADKQLTRAELEALMSSLRSGQVDVDVSGPATGADSLPTFIPLPVTAAPEDAPDLPAADIEADVMPLKKVWDSLKNSLQDRGIDLAAFDVVSADRELTARELSLLLSALKNGAAEVSVTGPVLGGEMPQPTASPDDGDVPRPPALEVTADEQSALQWAGLAPALGKKASYLEVTTEKQWKKVWRRLGGKKPPEIDFKKYMIVGVIVGSDERADQVKIVDVKKSMTGVHIQFKRVVHRRMVSPLGAEQAKVRDLVPYHLRVIPKTGLNIQFENVRERGG